MKEGESFDRYSFLSLVKEEESCRKYVDKEFHSCGFKHTLLFLRPSHSCDRYYLLGLVKEEESCHKYADN